MKKLFIAECITIGMLMAASVGWSQDKPNQEKMTYAFDGASCEVVKSVRLANGNSVQVTLNKNEDTKDADGIVCRTEYPLMTDRLASYGSIKVSQDRTGQSKREFDTSQDSKLTAAGRELYNNLMGIMVGRLWAISTAPIGYNIVTIVPYPQVPYDMIIDPIKQAFEKSARIDAAVK